MQFLEMKNITTELKNPVVGFTGYLAQLKKGHVSWKIDQKKIFRLKHGREINNGK